MPKVSGFSGAESKEKLRLDSQMRCAVRVRRRSALTPPAAVCCMHATCKRVQFAQHYENDWLLACSFRLVRIAMTYQRQHVFRPHNADIAGRFRRGAEAGPRSHES